MKRSALCLLALILLCACPPRRGDDDDDSSGGGSSFSDGVFVLVPTYDDQGASYQAGYFYVPREEENLTCEAYIKGQAMYYGPQDDDYDYLYFTLYLGGDLDGWEREFQHLYSGNCGYNEDDPSSINL